MHETFTRSMSDIVEIRSSKKDSICSRTLLLLNEAAKEKRVKFFYYKKNRPIGYAAWISVNKESALMFKATGVLPLFPHEWNEGWIKILFDVCFANGWERLARRYFVDYLISQRCIFYKKRGTVRVFSRKERRMSSSYFTKE